MNFDELYKKLNTEQKEAVDTLEGPVMIIAGPGTGKTQILTLRIANILRKELASPEQILALTFSEAGVSALKRRLTELLGEVGYYVPVFTFHGFCNDIIQRYPDEFPQIGKEENIGEVEQIELVRNILDTGEYKKLRPFGRPYYYVPPLLSTISDLKREGITPEDLKERTEKEEKELLARDDLYHEKGKYKGKMKGVHQDAQKNIEKNKELADVYTAYQEALRESGQYDYNDMILFVLEKLENDADFLVRVGDAFSYILVDEHQDTNNAQNAVLRNLAEEENPNIFVVGDEKQAVYRFQGASLENFLYFHKLFPKAKLISLRKNYRSGQNLLDSALAVIAHNKKSIGTVLPHIKEGLESHESKDESDVLIHELVDEQEENAYIVREIQDLIKNGASPKEIVVLVREHKDAAPIAGLLDAQGIAHFWKYPKKLYEDPWAEKIIRILRYIDDFGTNEKLIPVLHLDIFNIPPLEIYQFISEKKESDKVKRAQEYLSSWKTSVHNETPLKVFGDIVREGGFLETARKKGEEMLALQGIRALFQEIRIYVDKNPRVTLTSILEYLDTLDEYNARLRTRVTRPSSANSVSIMTVHGSKGMEFDYVFIPRMHDARWGGRKRPAALSIPHIAKYDTEDERYEEERRLFFVGLTRARKTVYLTFARENDTGKEQVPSIFLNELKQEVQQIRSKPFEEFDVAPKRKASQEDMRIWVQELFSRRGFSVTAFNNYLECPWKYFYRNLLQVPSAPSKQQLYGISVHDALNNFFTEAQAGTVPALPTLVGKFEESLEKQALSKKDFEEILKKGRASLTAWFTNYNDTWNYNTENELSITVPFTSELRLTGKIDKLEITGNNVVVVDYKTGKSKTRGEIEGTTKNSNGALKRQLVFYKILLDKDKKSPYTMVAGELDFVEPDPKGNLHKEQFVISDTEARGLEKDIHRVTKEIIELKFWDTRCEDKKCEWCKLRE